MFSFHTIYIRHPAHIDKFHHVISHPTLLTYTSPNILMSVMAPRQLTGILKNFKYHAAIPEGETVIVDDVKVEGKGKPFYYQKFTGGSLITLCDLDHFRDSDVGESTAQIGEPRNHSELGTERANEEAEGPSGEASGQLAEPQAASQAEQEDMQGGGRTGGQPNTVSSGATANSQKKPTSWALPGGGPAQQWLEEQVEERPNIPLPDALSILYQPYPEGFQLDVDQRKGLPDFPQLHRPGRREKPWGHKSFSQASQGDETGGTADPTAAKPIAAKPTTQAATVPAVDGPTYATQHGRVTKKKQTKTVGGRKRVARTKKAAV